MLDAHEENKSELEDGELRVRQIVLLLQIDVFARVLCFCNLLLVLFPLIICSQIYVSVAERAAARGGRFCVWWSISQKKIRINRIRID